MFIEKTVAPDCHLLGWTSPVRLILQGVVALGCTQRFMHKRTIAVAICECHFCFGK
ncbi:uncharacterized protein BDW43DRAFT_288317 [Aspergillus alliaceus]|uniref:uncharacterized protein n=1 Tax=Petromyces alliaceus TaxID=209559 RepID=UPI0012A43406|nr:uncharacterized protein BDW43DRAFT_288317 [Aspergillus alliaceus]KAB8229422.1 hypothetical protein BDW43DRAFT_288317 [Aspergillus alliaceus]